MATNTTGKTIMAPGGVRIAPGGELPKDFTLDSLTRRAAAKARRTSSGSVQPPPKMVAAEGEDTSQPRGSTRRKKSK